MKDQVEAACQKMKSTEFYTKASEINLVGVSQGGLMARYILEECDVSDHTKFRNLLTIGTPNMGVSEITPGACNTLTPALMYLCHETSPVLMKVGYSDLM